MLYLARFLLIFIKAGEGFLLDRVRQGEEYGVAWKRLFAG